MPSSVLVTGAGGFVGGHLLRRLRADGHEAVALARRPVPGGPCVVADLAADALSLPAVDAVVHCAAATPKRRGPQDAAAMVRGNVTATQRLLDALPASVRRIVLLSTVDVLSPSDEQAVGPRDPFGATKLLAEAFVTASGVEAVILRLGHVYGPGEGAYGKLIPASFARLAEGEAPVIVGDGAVLRDLLCVDDAVEGIVRALDRPEAAGRTLTLAGPSFPVADVVEAVRAAWGPSSPPAEQQPARGTTASLRFSRADRDRVLGAWPEVPLEDGLAAEAASLRAP